MKILLININPVVSRLLTLCTRDEDIELIEVDNAKKCEKTSYDIVFVDESSYVDDVKELLETLKARKKVFISYSNEAMKGFDETIKKPFLPSQIIAIIENVEKVEPEEDEAEQSTQNDTVVLPLSAEDEELILPDIFPLDEEDEETDDISKSEEHAGTEILDNNEIEKIKALLDMDDEDDLHKEDEILSDDEYEARKVKAIKEQLIADGLEIVEENEIVEELSLSALDTSKETEQKLEKKKKKKETRFNKDELSRIEHAMTVALGKMKPKKIKKLLKGKEIEIKIKLEDDD